MRQLLTISVIGLSIAWSWPIQGPPAKAAQFLQQPVQPGTENPPDQPSVNPPPRATPPPSAFRRGPRPRFNFGPSQAAPPGMARPVPGVGVEPSTSAAPRTAPAIPTPPGRPLQSVFLIPGGLSMPATDLFETLGIEPVHVVALTPTTSFDIAYKCYRQEMYSDAIVFARHGLTMCNDARLHLLKGVCELHLGRGAEAERTAAEIRNALNQQQVFGMEAAVERINDPLRVRFDGIVEYQNTGR
jgi:hypothetical protein